MSTLIEKIHEINELIRSFGRPAVQKIDFGGQIRYGYKPQYVFDAVNQIIGPENWRYELIKEEIFDNQVVAEVTLFLKTDADQWLCKGSHKGQMNIVKGNVGDAQKGAITDALQKCLSLCSIGQDSYRGLLETVYNSRSPQAPPGQSQSKRTPQSQPVPPEPTNSASLPKIDGITYEHHDSIIIAMGKVFDKKELLKAVGFKWNKDQKNWYKDLTTH